MNNFLQTFIAVALIILFPLVLRILLKFGILNKSSLSELSEQQRIYRQAPEIKKAVLYLLLFSVSFFVLLTFIFSDSTSTLENTTINYLKVFDNRHLMESLLYLAAICSLPISLKLSSSKFARYYSTITIFFGVFNVIYSTHFGQSENLTFLSWVIAAIAFAIAIFQAYVSSVFLKRSN